MEAQNDRKVEREKEEKEKIGAVADRSGGDEIAMPRLHCRCVPSFEKFMNSDTSDTSEGQKRVAADPPADAKERPEFTVVETIEKLVSTSLPLAFVRRTSFSAMGFSTCIVLLKSKYLQYL
jgi:hypothetical protein